MTTRRSRSAAPLPALCSLALLLLVAVQDAAAQTPSPPLACRRDYPIPTTAVDYRHTLAAGTLAPERITLRGRAVALGMTEAALLRALGGPPDAAEDWQPRSADGQCSYLLELLRQHPDSLHLYRFGELKLRQLEGEFRSLEWRQAGIGQLRAYLHRRSAGLESRVYLLHLAPEPVSLDKVRSKPGRPRLLVRDGTARFEWNLDNNSVQIAMRR